MDVFHRAHVPLVQSFVRRYPIFVGVCVLLRAITLGIIFGGRFLFQVIFYFDFYLVR